MKTIFIYAGMIIILASCGHRPKAEQDTAGYTVQDDTITVAASSSLAASLKTIVVQNQSYQRHLVTVGTVKAIPTQYAEIAPPFAGRVVKSYLQLGMQCRQGTPLFEISSPDFVAAQKIFFQEKAQLEQASKTLQRQKDLVAHGVGTQKDLEEAQTAYAVEKQEYDNAVIGIRIFQADPDNLSLGQPLVVRSPIAGEVIANNVVVGQYLKEDASNIATVAELSKVWIAGQVKEKDIPYIHELDACEIDVASQPDKYIKGKIFHVEAIMDNDTRSVQVLVEANNADRTLKPGMYVTVNFSEVPDTAILIPSTALLQASDAKFVFLKIASGKYVKRQVQTDGVQVDKTVIKSGLEAGDTIISEGSYYLQDAQ